MPVKPLLFVQTMKEECISDEDFITSSSDDEKKDEPWFPNESEAKKCKLQEQTKDTKKEKFKQG